MAQHSTKAIASSGNVIHTSLSESDLSARHSTNEPSKHKGETNTLKFIQNLIQSVGFTEYIWVVLSNTNSTDIYLN